MGNSKIEMITQRHRAPCHRAPRPYTSEEDTLIVDMRQRGATYAEIARALNRSIGSIQRHGSNKLNLFHVNQRGPNATSPEKRPNHCPNCTILFTATKAPPAPSGVCIWCAQETAPQEN